MPINIKKIKIIIGILISLISLFYLWSTIDAAFLSLVVSRKIYYWYLIPFGLTSFLILVFYGVRWKQLLDDQIKFKEAIISGVICLGGNMFLPLRGGEALRLHYLHCNELISLEKLFTNRGGFGASGIPF